MTCRYCNAEVAPSARFCTNCRGDLSIFDKCVNCGELIDKGTSVCPYCGTRQPQKRHNRQNDSKMLKWILGCVLLLGILCVRYYLIGVGDSTQTIRGTEEMEAKRHVYVLAKGVTVGISVYESFKANSKYDNKVHKIHMRSMSMKDKDAFIDKAEIERNKVIGGNVGAAVGAAAGAALGCILGPSGAVAGGWFGSMVGEWVGNGIGGLFGGNRSEKYDRRAHVDGNLLVTDDNLNCV